MDEQTGARNRAERRAAMRSKGRRAAGAALTAGSAALAMTAGVLARAPAAHAAGTYTVDQNTDDGTGGTTGSLSWAIGQANGDPGSTIDFSVTGSISIDGTMPHITAPVAVVGPGASVLTIDGNDTHRILSVDASADAVTISGLTLANGASEGDPDGAAILSGAGITLSDSVITGGNATSDGGALYVDTPGALVISDTTFSDNHTLYDDGGAVAVNEAASVSITGSTFDANTAGGAGGALYVDTSGVPTTITGSRFTRNHSGTDPGPARSAGAGGAVFDDDQSSDHTLTITGSTFTGNVAEAYGGGAVQMYSDGGGGSVVVQDSVVSNNQAVYSGGGLYFYGIGSATILRTTISGNTASLGESGTGGGGLFVGSASGGEVDIGESTLSGNQGASGGGMWLYSDSPVHVFNSTVSGNTATADEGGGVTLLYVDGFYMTQDTVSANHAATVGGLYSAGVTSHAAAGRAQARATKAGPRASEADGDEGARRHPAKSQRVHARGVGEVGAVSTILSANEGDDVGGVAATLHSNHSLLGTNGADITVDDQGGTIRSGTPELGLLQDNGGPTATQALLPGSPAIDAGLMPVPSFTGREFDQRGDGYPRVVNGTVDVGAYEVQAEAPAPVVIRPRFTG